MIYDKLDTLTNKNKYQIEDIRSMYRDTTPTDFGISNKTDVSPGSKHISEEIVVGGINDYIPVVAPEGVTIYVNGNIVGSGTLIYNGDRVKFELIAPNTNGAIADYNLRVGDISKTVSLYTSNFSFDYYIAPYGNDTTGDGSYSNPFRTLKMCPLNSKIGLLPGVYSDRTGSEPKHYGYISIHGYHGGAVTSGWINLTRDVGSNPKGLPQKNYKLHSKFLTIDGFSGRTGNYTLIGAVEPGTVIIEMGSASDVRDYPFNFYSNVVFSDIIINASRDKTTNYSSSWSKWSTYTIYLNCQFNETGYYSLQYHNESNNPIAYVNCKFTGNRLSNYSGVARELTMSITREEYLNSN